MNILTKVSVTAFALGLATETFAEKWNVSVWGKRRAFTAHVEKLAELVSAKTGGEFTMNISYGGLSKTKENLDGISSDDVRASKLRQFNFSDDDIKAFNILSLNIGAEWTIIRDKFKKLVKRFHPDKNSGNKKYEEKLKIITLAYTQLKRSYRK